MADPRKFRREEGDWLCPDSKCGNLNFAKRTKCNRCGARQEHAPAPKRDAPVEIGAAAAEKSKGLFAADDWQCKMCGNVNWARRNTCNMCNAPKYGKVEERTGYGGGFMEREENVEYKESRHRDDDEYDEFGRKKKSYRTKSSDKPRAPTQPQSQPQSQPAAAADDDEDEDEDDEGDVSAYKLDSEEEEDVRDGRTSASKSESRSRSRSTHSSRSRSSSRSSRSGSGRGRKRSYSRSRSRSRSRSTSRGKRRRSDS